MKKNFMLKITLKAFLLFVLLNFLMIMLPKDVGRLSLYNVLLEGRLRFPFGENPKESYNFSLFDIDAMFASHVINGESIINDEYHVLLLGDSSTWGTLLRPEETISGLLDASNLVTCDGKTVRFYNLGYPTVSLTKDLMFLDYAMRYKPDLVIWIVTLESFPLEKQLTSPIVSNNAVRVDDLILRYNLSLNSEDPDLVRLSFWDKTLIGRRRSLADLIRLQLYGIPWSATGIDQVYPSDYQQAQTDLAEDITFYGQTGPHLDVNQLSFEILDAGMDAVGDVPLLIINEPMLISSGENSTLRYNFFYPRWAYDQYRSLMKEKSRREAWKFLDLWNIVPASEFTNSAIHTTPLGVTMIAQKIFPILQTIICP